MHQENSKPEWFALADSDRASVPSRSKKRLSLLLVPAVIAIAGVAYVNLHGESSADAATDQSTVAVQNNSVAAPQVSTPSAAPVAPQRITAPTAARENGHEFRRAHFENGHDGEFGEREGNDD